MNAKRNIILCLFIISIIVIKLYILFNYHNTFKSDIDIIESGSDYVVLRCHNVKMYDFDESDILQSGIEVTRGQINDLPNKIDVDWGSDNYHIVYNSGYKAYIDKNEYIDYNHCDFTVKIDGLIPDEYYTFRPIFKELKSYNFYFICRNSIQLKTKKIITNGYDAIDLGLSVLWCNKNLGARTSSDPGIYGSNGATIKDRYSGSYHPNWSRRANTTIDPVKDILGDRYRLPTENEVNELFTKCKWEWTNIDGIDGYKVIGPNKNSIFLPTYKYNNKFGSRIGIYMSDNVDTKFTFTRYRQQFIEHSTDYKLICIRPVLNK